MDPLLKNPHAFCCGTVVCRVGFLSRGKAKTMLLQDFHDDYWLPFVTERLREVTVTGYESTWHKHLESRFGDVEMADISRRDIEAWLAAFERPGAARKAWAVLRGILRRAVRWEILAVDVTSAGVDLPRARSRETPWLRARQIRELLRGFYGHPLEAWLLCALNLGLRREEGLGLEWSDIDLRSGRVRIERGLQWVHGHEVIVEPKTELSRRQLVLPKFATKRLREIRGHGRLIGDLTPLQAARMYQSWCKSQRLPYVPPMNLRTTWATNALQAGIDISVVAKMLGHASIETTARYYLQPDLRILADAQRAWERKIIG